MSRPLSIPPPPPPPPPPSSQRQRAPYPDYDKATADESPWKYVGYRVFAKWMASEQTFFIVRRFGALNTRVILALQDEIVELEQQLNHLDEDYSRKDANENHTHNGSFRFDGFEDRRNLIQDILPEKLAKYNTAINSYSQLVARPEADPSDVLAVKQWFREIHPNAIEDLEQNFIEHEDDLIPVQPKQRSWFRRILENTLLLDIRPVRSYFSRTPQDHKIIDDDRTIWQRDKRLEKLSSAVIGMVGLSMLIGPLWILEYVNRSWAQLLIISGFIVVFFVLVLVATAARTFDALAATAAYSAVLTVFLQFGKAGS